MQERHTGPPGRTAVLEAQGPAPVHGVQHPVIVPCPRKYCRRGGSFPPPDPGPWSCGVPPSSGSPAAGGNSFSIRCCTTKRVAAAGCRYDVPTGQLTVSRSVGKARQGVNIPAIRCPAGRSWRPTAKFPAAAGRPPIQQAGRWGQGQHMVVGSSEQQSPGAVSLRVIRTSPGPGWPDGTTLYWVSTSRRSARTPRRTAPSQDFRKLGPAPRRRLPTVGHILRQLPGPPPGVKPCPSRVVRHTGLLQKLHTGTAFRASAVHPPVQRFPAAGAPAPPDAVDPLQPGGAGRQLPAVSAGGLPSSPLRSHMGCPRMSHRMT